MYLGEAVGDAAQGRAVEEGHGRAQHRGQQRAEQRFAGVPGPETKVQFLVQVQTQGMQTGRDW